MVRRRSTVRFRNGAPAKDQVRSSPDGSHPTRWIGAIAALGGIWEIVSSRLGQAEAGGSCEGSAEMIRRCSSWRFKPMLFHLTCVLRTPRFVTFGDNLLSRELRCPLIWVAAEVPKLEIKALANGRLQRGRPGAATPGRLRMGCFSGFRGPCWTGTIDLG